MKIIIKSIILSVLSFVNMSVAYSQDIERESVIDSIAFGTLDRADLCDVDLLAWSLETTRLEYAVFTYARNSLSHHYKDLSDADLRKVKDFLVSEPYRKLCSISFWDSYKKTFIDKAMVALGTIPDFSTELDDKEYLSAATELCRYGNLKQMAVTSADQCIEYIGKMTGTNSPSSISLNKMKRNVEDILAYVMMDYLAIEEIHYLLDFLTSDFHHQLQKNCPLRDINDYFTAFNCGRMNNSFSRYSYGSHIKKDVRHMVPVISKIAESASNEEVVQLLKQIRQVPFPFFDKYKASGSMEMDGGLYIGQLRDGKAEGNGTFKASDGTIYAGSFKDGNLHGFVKMNDASNSFYQLWNEGILVNAHVTATEDDILSPVPMYKGWPHGVGSYQLQDNISGGFFVDGRLHGKGISIDRRVFLLTDIYEITYNGIFDEGVFKNGIILEKHKAIDDREFKGNLLCQECAVGELKVIDSDKNIVKSIDKGTIVNDHIEGEGVRVRHYNDSLTTRKTGFFVKGLLYGHGTKETTTIMPSGIKSEQICSGFFWDDELYKDVVITETFSGIPAEKGVVRVLRSCGVRIVARNVSELVVECRGEFKDELLVNGKVTVSDGTWKEGVFANGEHVSGRAKTIDKYGTIYIGDIRDGRYHGKGKCIYADKTWFEGNFVEGVRKDGIYYDANGVKIRDVK